eukprot:5216122-Amphidinium_carterae.1
MRTRTHKTRKQCSHDTLLHNIIDDGGSNFESKNKQCNKRAFLKNNANSYAVQLCLTFSHLNV